MDRAIAEHLGWTAHPTCRNVWRTPEQAKTNMELIGTVSGPWSTDSSGPPRYSTDLNAMHEAVSKLTALELYRYADEVCDLAYDGYHETDIQKILKMEAKELAECYVRAIGKWREPTT